MMINLETAATTERSRRTDSRRNDEMTRYQYPISNQPAGATIIDEAAFAEYNYSGSGGSLRRVILQIIIRWYSAKASSRWIVTDKMELTFL